MYKAIKIRLYPTVKQTKQFNKLLGCNRLVYNKCLDYKINSYKDSGKSENLTTLSHYLHNTLTKQEEYDFLNEHNTKVYKATIMNMLEAFNLFFKRGNKGFPKFKSKHDNKQSCRFPVEAISKKNNYNSSKLSLANIKGITFRTSDKYKEYLVKYKEGIKSATLTKSCSNNYYLSILVDSDEVLKKPTKVNTVGIDLGIKTFVTCSDGSTYDNLRLTRNNEKKHSKLQRCISRKVKGSNNRNKARIRFAMFSEKIRNKKINYLHSVVNALLNDNQVIVMEDLNVSGMLKNHCLSKSIQDVSFSEFRSILSYKSIWYGRELVFVDRFFASSKLCSHCGYKNVDLLLKDRYWFCPNCGFVHDRDFNASVNILHEGLHLLTC